MKYGNMTWEIVLANKYPTEAEMEKQLKRSMSYERSGTN